MTYVSNVEREAITAQFKSVITTICMFPDCGVIINLIDGRGQTGISHGICEHCYEKHYGE